MSNQDQLQFEPGAVKAATKGMTSSDLWKAPRSALHIDPNFNVRVHDAEYKAHIRTIADSIKANGFYPDKPIAGFVAKRDGQDVIIVTDGHSRIAGFDLAVSEGFEGTDLPVVTKPRGTSMEDLTIALVTSNSGRQLAPYEVALVCKRLVGYGMEPKAIAQRLGFTLVYVNGLLDLVAAPKALRDLVASGKVSATLAIETLRKEGSDAAKVLTAGVKEATASGKERVTKKHVKAATTKAEKKGKKGKPAAEQQALPLDVDPKVAEMEAVLKRGVQWWLTRGGGGTQTRDLLIGYTAALTGLSEAEVQPYFEDDL
jgi:ParB family chromosome partitioning protein